MNSDVEAPSGLTQLAVSAIACALVLLLCEGLSFVLFAPIEKYGIRGQLQHLREGTYQDATTLFTGSSHIADGIARDAWPDSALVLAHGNQDLYYDHALVQAAADYAPNVRLIVLGVDLHSLTYALDAHDEFLVAQYSAAGIPRRSAASFGDSLRSRSYFLRYQPVMLREGLKRMRREINGTPSASVPSTSVPPLQTSAPAPSERQALQRVHLHFTARRAPILIEANTRILLALTALAKQRGWAVVWVTSPLSAPYRANMPEQGRRARAQLRALAARASVRWIDDSENPQFSDAHFDDPDHLNADGAVLWTTRLAETLAPE